MFSHEKLDVYRLSIEFVAWVYQIAKKIKGQDRSAKDQILRSSQSIPQNIAEGNGRKHTADRARFLQIAYGSALESAATLDILYACEVITSEECSKGKSFLERIVAMLIAMIKRINGEKSD